jgi:hypothetical protein
MPMMVIKMPNLFDRTIITYESKKNATDIFSGLLYVPILEHFYCVFFKKIDEVYCGNDI